MVVEDGEGDLVCPGGALLQPHAVPGPPEQLASRDQVAVSAHKQLNRGKTGHSTVTDGALLLETGKYYKRRVIFARDGQLFLEAGDICKRRVIIARNG